MSKPCSYRSTQAVLQSVAFTTTPPVNAEFLHERLPHSKLNILDAGHFVWEEAADEYVAIISAWVQGGYQDRAAGTGSDRL